MQSPGKNTELISALGESMGYPFIALDPSGNIVAINSEAAKIFRPAGTGNIYDLVHENSGVLIKRVIETALKEKECSQTIDLALRSGDEIKYNVSVKSYRDESRIYLFAAFRKHQISVSGQGKGTLKLKTKEVKNLIRNDELYSIIDEIKALYPFTYIGKEKIRNLVNRLNVIFWIKDNEGNFVLVNNKFANSLELIPEAIEGKPENTFTPVFLAEFRSTLEEYIKTSLQWISSAGFPVHGIHLNENIIQLPLIDSGGNLTAVIGFSQPEEDITGIPSESEIYQIVKIIPDAAAVIGDNGEFKEVNKYFCTLFRRNSEEISEIPAVQLLPAEIFQKIKLFLGESSKEFSFDYLGRLYENEKTYYHIHLKKTSESGKSLFIIIERDVPEETLESLLNRRGIMFDLLIQNNPQPVFIYDKENLRFLEVNDAALKLYGYRRDEFLKMDLTDLYTPEDIQTLLDSSTEVSTGTKFSGPYRHKRKDGSSVFVELSKVNFKYSGYEAHFNIVRDVTDKLQLLNQNQLFKAAFDNTENLVFVVDSSGFITFVNKSVQDVLGYSKKDLDNTSFTALVPNEERGNISTAVFKATPRDVILRKIDLKKMDGGSLQCEIVATPVVDYKNEITSFTIIGKYEKETPKEIIKEITKEVIKEVPREVVREVPVEVIKEVYVEKRASGVPAAADQKENLAFLSSLFHDILTPINVILGFVQEITESIDKPSPEQKESIEIINQNRENLLNIMNSIVEYSSIEKDTIELNISEIQVTEIIDSIQNEIEPVISSRGIEFAYGRISSSLKFKSDKQRMMSFILLLVKMVSNISKEKKIYFSAYHLKENEFILSIKNNYTVSTGYLVENFSIIFLEGENNLNKDFGIPKLNIRLAKALLRKLKGRFELIEKGDSIDYGFVFPVDFSSAPEIRYPAEEKSEPAYKPDYAAELEAETEPEEEFPEISAETEPEVKPVPDAKPAPEKKKEEQYAEPEPEIEDLLSEEELELESDLSALQTELAAKAPDAEPAPQRKEKIDLSKMSCLYIEDQVDSQILFKVQMKDLKDVKFAVTFEEALPLLDNNRFDFIVIDINLQGEYNGIDAMKIIRDMPAYKNTPLIAVTAYVLPGDRERFIATGFHDFISKPMFREKMVNSLEQILLTE